jgi:hypothetical protein
VFKISLQMPCAVLWNVDNGLPTFQHHHFTTPWWSELRDTFPGCDRVGVEIYWVAVIELIWRYTSRQWSSQHRDALRDHDRERFEMDLEAVMKWDSWYTWTPLSAEYGDAPGGCDHVSLEVWTWRPW